MLWFLPVEVLLPILELAGDLLLAIKVESILLHLPHRYSNRLNAYDDLEPEHFPVSSRLAQSLSWKTIAAPATLCEICWFIRFWPCCLMWSKGAIWQYIADQNTLGIFVALHKTKATQGFPMHLLDKAVEHGNLDAVEYLWSLTALEAAAEGGQLDVVSFLSDFIFVTSASIVGAARGGHLDVLQYLITKVEMATKSRKVSASFVNEALRDALASSLQDAVINKHAKVVEYLISNGRVSRRSDIYVATLKAIKNGDMRIVRLMFKASHGSSVIQSLKRKVERGDASAFSSLEFSSAFYSETAIKRAAASGNLELVRFLCEEVVPRPPNLHRVLEYAPIFGYQKVVEYLYHQGVRGKVALNRVIATGNLDLIQFLHKHCEVSCTAQAMDTAAGMGHLDIVKFLHTNRNEGCTTAAMNMAAENGHLDVIQWLHANRNEGCTTRAMNLAAGNGHLDVVSWLHHNRSEGCTDMAMDLAASNNQRPVLEFLHFNRSEGCSTLALDSAVASPDASLEVLMFLHTYRHEGCTTRAMDAAAMKSDLSFLKFLAENRSEGCSQEAVKRAAEMGLIKNVRFLCEHYGIGSSEALVQAATHGHLEVVEFLSGIVKKGFCVEKVAFDTVLKMGFIDVARHLLRRNLVQLDAATMLRLSRTGYLLDVLSLKEKGMSITTEVIQDLCSWHSPESIQVVLGL
ncbi:hypothetical protein HDU97_000168 [Phlyctochytrium planicorne]|nr:hypothetical protein HDU97_000168 [Phlyctochytrium planicorne]